MVVCGAGLRTVVHGDDVQAVEQLALVLVDPLDVNVEHGGRVDLHAVLLLQVLGKLLLVVLRGASWDTRGEWRAGNTEGFIVWHSLTGSNLFLFLLVGDLVIHRGCCNTLINHILDIYQRLVSTVQLSLGCGLPGEGF